MGKIGDSTSVQNSNPVNNETKAAASTTPKTEAKTSTVPLDDSTSGATSKLGAVNTSGATMKDKLQSFDGTTPAAPEVFSKEATVTKTGGQVIIDAGKGDDQIGVSQDAKGNITVKVNGE